jgi:ABC-type branched-subunit amino acid transport system ATPase component
MKHLHYVEIENFKRYGERQRIELDHPAVLIGPNNCGKTSVLQAIALWSIGLRTWKAEAENSKAEKRPGKALNRLNILSVPVPKTRFFWNNLRVTKRDLIVTVAVDVRGKPVDVTMIFQYDRSDELVYCKPAKNSLREHDALAAAVALDVSLLYPMSGISADEAVILPKRIDYLMGRGSTAEVLRNICLQIHQTAPADWQEVAGLMERLFHVELGEPMENEKGAVDLGYRQDGVAGVMDLSLSGRGFQQMLLIFAHLFLHKGCVLLIDEPDAHLEILRQQQVFTLLRDIARRNRCQVVIVTHSEVVLAEALETNLTLILDGKPDNLATRTEIQTALKHFGAEHYVRARETGHVLYVEGSTDVDMLRAFARKIGHAASALLEDGARLNVYYLQDNYPEAERTPEAELERVEGGYGLKPEEHFHALRRMLPELRGLVIQDNDGRSRTPHGEGYLRRFYWKRYEAENYFITPELLLSEGRRALSEVELFAQQPVEVLRSLILEKIFDGSAEDLANYERADGSTRRTLWRAQTHARKLSSFAEEYFRRLGQATGTPMAHTKGGLHDLVARCDAGELNGEVKDALDAIVAVLGAHPRVATP